MCLTNEHVGPKILAKIKICVLTRAELLITHCYEIPCTKQMRICTFPNRFAKFIFSPCQGQQGEKGLAQHQLQSALYASQ